MKQQLKNRLVHRLEHVVAATAMASTFGMSGALHNSFTEGQAGVFITWFRANFLESGWIVALSLIALLGGIVGMFMGEQRGMKILYTILICLATAFLGADQIIHLVKARL